MFSRWARCDSHPDRSRIAPFVLLWTWALCRVRGTDRFGLQRTSLSIKRLNVCSCCFTFVSGTVSVLQRRRLFRLAFKIRKVVRVLNTGGGFKTTFGTCTPWTVSARITPYGRLRSWTTVWITDHPVRGNSRNQRVHKWTTCWDRILLAPQITAWVVALLGC